MHALRVLLFTLGLNRANNRIDAHINELPKGILGYIKIHLGFILVINFVINLIVKLGYGLKTVLTGVDDCAGFSLNFISEAYFVLICA